MERDFVARYWVWGSVRGAEHLKGAALWRRGKGEEGEVLLLPTGVDLREQRLLCGVWGLFRIPGGLRILRAVCRVAASFAPASFALGNFALDGFALARAEDSFDVFCGLTGLGGVGFVDEDCVGAGGEVFYLVQDERELLERGDNDAGRSVRVSASASCVAELSVIRSTTPNWCSNW